MSNSQLLPNYPEGQLFVVSAPSGTGKTTLIQLLKKEFSRIVTSITYTTRDPREGEVNGVDYHFITSKQFFEKKARGEFLETVELYDVHYGSSLVDVQMQMGKGRIVVLVIDTQGMLALKKTCPFPFTSIFVRPPSHEKLSQRLQHRLTESATSQKKRLDRAEKELELEKYYDYSLLNDDLKIAYETLRCIFIAENHRINKT